MCLMSSCLVISSRALATSLLPSSISASLAESCRSFHSRKSNDKCWVPVQKIIMEIYFACLLVAVFLHRSRCQTQPSGALPPRFWAKNKGFEWKGTFSQRDKERGTFSRTPVRQRGQPANWSFIFHLCLILIFMDQHVKCSLPNFD